MLFEHNERCFTVIDAIFVVDTIHFISHINRNDNNNNNDKQNQRQFVSFLIFFMCVMRVNSEAI